MGNSADIFRIRCVDLKIRCSRPKLDVNVRLACTHCPVNLLFFVFVPKHCHNTGSDELMGNDGVVP